MFVTTILVFLCTVLTLKWIRDRKYAHSLFRRLGIPGPEPSLLFGNFAGFREKGLRITQREWTKQYGKVFGYYEGAKPFLMVSDPELVKQIAIKDFNKFHSRREPLFQNRDDPKENMFNATGDKWKRLRSVASPSFTTGRMKQMSPTINKCVTSLIKLFDDKCKSGVAFDIYSEFGRLTTDVISNVAFGIDAGCLEDPKSPFLVRTRRIFDEIEKFPLSVKIFFNVATFFPGLAKFLRTYIPFTPNISFEWHYETAKKIIMARQESGDTTRQDFVNLMLETNRQLRTGNVKEQNDDADDKDDENGFLKADTKIMKKQQPMSIEEMQGQIVIFLNAGYETTSTALGFTAYHLALSPDVQTKLQREIDEHFPDKDVEPDYTQVQSLKYMENVLKEVLRLHPIAHIATTRTCYEDVKYGDITIPKGVTVHLNMDDLHYNPDLWGSHSPEEFVPERFDEDCQETVNTLAWIPFGAGPRICLGMRFAILEYKVALTRILKTFTIKRCAETKVPCPTKKNGVFSPSEGVYVKLERRA